MSENTTNRALRLMGMTRKLKSAGMDSGQWPVAPGGVGPVVTRYGGAANEPPGRNSVRAAYVHKAEHLEARKA